VIRWLLHLLLCLLAGGVILPLLGALGIRERDLD